MSCGTTYGDWRTYPILSLGTEMPHIETALIDRPDEVATGVSETASAPRLRHEITVRRRV
jgi:hypothetical protein